MPKVIVRIGDCAEMTIEVDDEVAAALTPEVVAALALKSLERAGEESRSELDVIYRQIAEGAKGLEALLRLLSRMGARGDAGLHAKLLTAAIVMGRTVPEIMRSLYAGHGQPPPREGAGRRESWATAGAEKLLTDAGVSDQQIADVMTPRRTDLLRGAGRDAAKKRRQRRGT